MPEFPNPPKGIDSMNSWMLVSFTALPPNDRDPNTQVRVKHQNLCDYSRTLQLKGQKFPDRFSQAPTSSREDAYNRGGPRHVAAQRNQVTSFLDKELCQVQVGSH